MLLMLSVVRVEVVVHYTTGAADQTYTITSTGTTGAYLRTGNGVVVEALNTPFLSRSSGGAGQFSISYVVATTLIDSADSGKLKVKIKPIEFLTGGSPPSPANGIASVDVKKITVMFLPAFSLASPGVSPGVLITQTGGGSGSGGNGGGIPTPPPVSDSLKSTSSLLVKMDSLNGTLGELE